MLRAKRWRRICKDNTIKYRYDDLIKCILEDIGDSISQSSAMDYIKRLLEKGIITTKEALIIRAAIDRRNLNLNVSDEGALRANILKGIISSILYYQSL